MKLEDIYFRMRRDIKEIEKEISMTIATDQKVLHQASHQLFKAGGKRIRPVFVLLAGHFGNYQFDKLKKVAAALEIIHMATLVHDDVIDDADKRRGKLTVKAQWDNKVAMYTGDYLLAKFLQLITELENPEIHKILSKILVSIVEGEIDQIKDFNNWEQSLKQYLRRIKRKTAILLAVSTQLGAIASDAETKVVRYLYQYGYNVGMAFQIIDDVLDYTGTTAQLGKPAGSDLSQGNITLPALYAVHCSDERDQLLELIKNDQISEKIDQVVACIKRSDGIEYSKRLAQRYIIKAQEALEKLPNIKEKETLFEISEFIAKRTY
ncbi:heptaprenyl diphosphate synthase [Vulcanibacillus modesticaldus]|uniref:Heptaprenyl diphosphate synthase n=1 Tax=Vulcanibacillus modesticaldus TaxID=337097 RepID=A0A1D2YSL0_9BACI|nr:polyprenyl synthetase family protein [Vulcanibacillus modesticaldus]OEF97299.1 heptaprenyl diphosphate synthase [Vulcanibacillus modesticaldus]